MNFDLKSYLASEARLVNERLESIFREKASPAPRLDAAMCHSLFAGGKRLRPVLTLASARTVAGNHLPEEKLSACLDCACAIEMIHTYSLIHDDLPAMDDDDLRRGMATCHKAFDEATAILAGDALLTLAFTILSELGGKGVEAHAALKVLSEIGNAAGSRGMVAGQMLDMEAQGKGPRFDDLKKLHSLKTGALIVASFTSGAILAGANREGLEALSLCGEYAGLAFQIQDDILNITGDPELMGKAAGSDFERGKATFPAVLGMKKAEEEAGKLVKKALESLALFGESAKALRALVSYMVTRQK